MDAVIPKHKVNSRKPLKGKTVAVVCSKHGFVRGDHCPKCVEESKSVSGPNVHVFKPMVYEDICETPLLITSKRQLRRECDKHGVRACRLM